MTHKILVVDDDAAVRDVLSRFLVKIGYKVSTAVDGQAGLAALEKERPSLVLLDMQMPNLSGLEFLEAARKVHPELAVIMVTGQGEEAAAKKAMELGATDYISKPLDFDYLETSVKAKLATILE